MATTSDHEAAGWALKERCYAAWSSNPPAALAAARELRELSERHPSATLSALADWCDGIAGLIDNRMHDALAALDLASAAWQTAGDALHAAQSRVPRLMALTVLGRFDEAEADALATVAALRAAGDERAAAKVRLNLGSLAFSRDRHEHAVEHYRAAAVRFARIGDQEHSVMADIGIADASTFLGRFESAQQHYARAAMRADTHGLPVLAASASHGQALLALSRGRFAVALAGLESARRSFAALGLVHRRIETEKNLADVYLELRLLPEAQALYAELAQTLAVAGQAATLPWVLAQQARAQALAGRHDAAAATLARAGAGFDAQGNVAGSATVAAVRAELQLSSDQPQAARAGALAAADAFGVAGLPGHAAAARLIAAAAALACGDAATACADCESLLADPALPPQVAARAGAERAAALLALGRHEAGLTALEAAIDAIEEQRAVLPGEDLQRAFLAGAVRPYQQRLALALQGGDADAVLRWLERFKARTLQDGGGAGRCGPAVADHRRARLDWIYRRQQRLVEDDDQTPQALRDEAAALEQGLLEEARRERLLAGGTTTVAAQPVDVAALAHELGPRRALVVYGASGDELFAVVVRHAAGASLQRRLASLADTGAAVQAVRFQLDAMAAGSAWPANRRQALAARARRRLAELHALIWRPLEPLLTGCDRLVIAPHGALHGVPFAALEDAGCALVDRYEIVLAASTGLAAAGLAEAAPVSGPALLFGDSTRLAHVAAELQALRAVLPQAECFEGDDASVERLLEAAPRASLLHLACHAHFRSDNALFSALHLSDGALRAEHVQGLRLRAGLVVLAACESGLGDHGVGDEGVGLVRAFLLAGARSVLASAWAVDDAFGASFMALFHRLRVQGHCNAAALRQAQRMLRADWPHPAHWAAFALHGAGS